MRYKYIILVVLFTTWVNAQDGEYYFMRSNKSKSIFVKNSQGQQIGRQLKLLPNFGVDHCYVYEKETKTLLELTNFYNISDQNYHPVKTYLKGRDPNYVFLFDDGTLVFYCEEREVNYSDINILTLNNRVFVMSPKNSKYTYKFLYTKGDVGIVELQKLPVNPINGYWFKTLSPKDIRKTDIAIVIDGKDAITSEFMLWRDEGMGFKIEDKFYNIRTFKSAKVYQANSLAPISEEAYTNAYNRFKEKTMNKLSKDAKRMSEMQETYYAIKNDIDSQPDTKATSKSVRCNGDISCLLSLSQQEYESTLKNGQSKKEAYQAMAKVFIEVYEQNPDLTYDMIMKMDGKHLMEVLNVVPQEIRTYVRTRSKQQVDAYVKEHGAPKIKTVEYKPKTKQN